MSNKNNLLVNACESKGTEKVSRNILMFLLCIIYTDVIIQYNIIQSSIYQFPIHTVSGGYVQGTEMNLGCPKSLQT